MLRRVYSILFSDDAGNACNLITEGEEMTRALVHNGYKVTVQDVVVQSDRLDFIHERLEKMKEEQEKHNCNRKQRYMGDRPEIAEDSSPSGINVGMEAVRSGR